MAIPSLDDLLTIPTQSEVVEQEVLPELRQARDGVALRVSDWLVGGVYRTFAWLVALLRVEARKAIASLAAGSLEEYAFGSSALPDSFTAEMRADVFDWAPIIARNRYGVEQIKATYTKRRITLTNTSAGPYGPIPIGRIILRWPSGNRYYSDEEITIPALGSVTGIFRSEFVHDSTEGTTYNQDPSGATIDFVTSPYVGVTATNPAGSYTAVSQVGSGTGTIALGGAPVGSHSVSIKVVASGQVGAGTWKYKIDGGAWSAAAFIGNLVNLGGFGINVTPSNGASSPSFVADNVLYFATPGTDITQTGRDEETPQELGARCYGMRPWVAFPQDSAGNWIPQSPTLSAYEALARTASSQVKIVLAATGTQNGVVRVLVAGQGSPSTPAVIATVQAYLDHYSMLTDNPEVDTSTARTITLSTSSIRVTAALLTSAQAEMQRRLGLYLGGVDPAEPLGINGLIDHAYIVSLIRTTPGVQLFDGVGFQINGAAANFQMPQVPGAYEQAVWTQQVAVDFPWMSV